MDRRAFLLSSAAAGAAVTLGCASTAPPAPPPASPVPPGPDPEPEPEAGSEPARAAAPPAKTMLILGGTGYLGPLVVEAAKARGYKVTLFNRGKTRPELFPDLEKLQGDRDPKKDEGLKALEGRSWEVVIDTSGYYPRMVSASAELLAPRIKQYIYISSVSAYAKTDRVGIDETAAVATLADPTVETMGKEFENYGGLKALCEQAAEKAMPGRVANVRPGFIVGPGDLSGRFTYWPVRVSQGGEMLAPGTAADPVQIIDGRDLAAWLVVVAERNLNGVFNAVGPTEPLTMGGMLEACKAATKSNARFTWVGAKFLKDHPAKVDLPIWVAPEGDELGFHTVSGKRAWEAGLTSRPVVDTARDTLAWWKEQPAALQEKMRKGLTPEVEAKVLADWKKAPKGGAGSKKTGK
ncbi:epimerase [Chondromyces apiculatus]|uniref:UDP-glucose 4-epimerase n=1 Tax=Chondromyces apiculatus DSM 436 TaxID=1192034 RepID=A0A017TBP8_9BACT|nr:epimerase [Chondromyces apiculatus]EYF06347.1 NAD dependent epimerase/dehydratase family [Chondromyces apiculatus DSM 436]